MFHQFHFLLVRRLAWFALAAAVLLWTESPILAQGRGQTTETKSGTIVEIQKKGRGRVLTVEIDGQQHSVPVTPKLDLQIIAQGDAGFVRPGQFLTATATLSNNKLFVQSLTIQPVQRGQKPPAGKIVKAPEEAGQSTMAYLVSGPIVATQTDKDYPDYVDVMLKVAGPNMPLMLEPGFRVTVNSANPELIPDKADAEFEVAALRGGRLNIVKVTVQLSEPLTAAEFFDDPAAENDAAKADDVK